MAFFSGRFWSAFNWAARYWGTGDAVVIVDTPSTDRIATVTVGVRASVAPTMAVRETTTSVTLAKVRSSTSINSPTKRT